MSEVTDEVEIGTIEQIPRGEGRNFLVGHTRVAVFRTHDDQVFATAPDCPHKQGPLADGMLGGTVILCPLHDRAYDLRTGAEIGGECSVPTYRIRSGDGGVLLLALPG